LRLTIKLGGSILEDGAIRGSLLHDIATLRRSGHEVILVHGGGKALNRALAQMGLESQFIGGLRVTDAATMRVATMVLAGEVNKMLVAELAILGVKSAGFSGADAGCVLCAPLSANPAGPLGLGFVGRPTKIDADFFDLLMRAGITPVVASIGLGEDGRLYNVNADQMASICACGTGCATLVYLTDVAGIKLETGEVIGEISESGIKELRGKGVLSGGMLPKTESCLLALSGGVDNVSILPGAVPGVLPQFFAGSKAFGTRIRMDAAAK
jgi:acetylglutamate kinase